MKIRARENGPYIIEGSGRYVDAEGNKLATPGKSVALCRCGHSSNLPFCDGSHKMCGFAAPPIEIEVE